MPCASHQDLAAASSPPPPPPLLSHPSHPSTRSKMSQSTFVSSEAHSSHTSASVHHARGRSHNNIRHDVHPEMRQDTALASAAINTCSPSAQPHARSASPVKHWRGHENMPSSASSTHIDTRSTMRGRDGGGGRNSGRRSSPSRSRHQIFEDPEVTDASSSVYSMDELIRAIPHIHPLYVKRIAEMGSPGRSSGQSTGPSPEISPTTLQEYTA